MRRKRGVIWTQVDVETQNQATAISPRIAEPSTGFLQSLVAISLVAAAIWVFGYVTTTLAILQAPTKHNLAALAAIIAFGIRWKSSELPRAFVAIAWAVNASCIGYIAASHSTYQLSFGHPWSDSVWVPVAVGLLGFWRPVLIVVPTVAMEWWKAVRSTAEQVPLVGTADYVIISDLAIFLALCMAAFGLYRVVLAVPLVRSTARRLGIVDVTTLFFSTAMLAAAAVHFSNYFYSGWAKISMPNTTASMWVADNPTYLLVVHATDIGLFTLPGALGNLEPILAVLVALNSPLNFVVLVSQLSSALVLLSHRASAAMTVFYDVMHVSIFLLTAIFFWKWIVLNLGFAYAFHALRRDGPRLALAIRVFGCALVLAAPFLAFHIVRLGWFDTGAVNASRFEAVTDGGERIAVPTNFFLEKSLFMAQQRFQAPFTGFLPTGTWGTTSDGDVFNALIKDCKAQSREFSLSGTAMASLGSILQRHHAMVLSKAGASGRIAYDWYPHHVWSNVGAFSRFKEIDLRSIRSYVLSVESRCVSVEKDGRINRNVIRKVHHEFQLPTR